MNCQIKARRKFEEDPQRNDCLHVAWYNCAGGLLAKIDNIKLILQIHDYDLLFVSETEIK